MENTSIMNDLDDKDFRILALLKANSRMTTKEMSKELEMPQTTVHNRIKKLTEKEVIKRFTIETDGKKIEKGLVAYILCTVSYRSTRGDKINQFEVAQMIKELPEVEGVSIVTGNNDLIVKAAVKDVDTLNDFVIFTLRNIEGLERTVTSVVLSEI
ncbi:MAG: Lrp/AsnC family transcriptional regulator [Candidatus Thorarchaeota archaeon]|nr:Lrp/AsnC family transcriptional regulator [Candidatus Thorarchaeota archaeon]